MHAFIINNIYLNSAKPAVHYLFICAIISATKLIESLGFKAFVFALENWKPVPDGLGGRDTISKCRF